MQYLIGSISTIISIWISIYLFKAKPYKKISVSPLYSQSRLAELMRPINALSALISIINKEEAVTQATKHYDSQHVRVIISENEAYWIANNRLHMADVKDYAIVQETAREVDTMAMDDVQLKRITEIVEMLGKDNDSGSTRN